MWIAAPIVNRNGPHNGGNRRDGEERENDFLEFCPIHEQKPRLWYPAPGMSLNPHLRRRTRGLQAVELGMVLSVTGTLLAIAVPCWMREARTSHFAEATDGLSRMSQSAIAYAHNRPASSAFPVSAPLTPATPPRGTREADPPGMWNHPTWQALKFQAARQGIPHAFAFGFESQSSPGQSAFVAHAHADFDGDGQVSTFELRGTADDSRGPMLEPGMYVDAELE